MKVIKRNGQEVEFNSDKIRKAVTNANNNIDELSKRLSTEQIEKIFWKNAYTFFQNQLK